MLLVPGGKESINRPFADRPSAAARPFTPACHLGDQATAMVAEVGSLVVASMTRCCASARTSRAWAATGVLRSDPGAGWPWRGATASSAIGGDRQTVAKREEARNGWAAWSLITATWVTPS